MPNYDFKKDWQVARKTEQEVTRWLEKHRKMKLIDECDNNEYDIRMRLPSGISVKIEVKEDFTCEKTGNVGLEWECRGKPSGISVSQADMYIYKIHRPDGKKGLYVIGVDSLKRMVDNKLYHREVVGGDPDSNSKNYLFKLEKIEEHFSFLGWVE